MYRESGAFRRLGATAGLAFAGALAFAFPLFPNIMGHDFNFGAFNGDGAVEYSTNGLAPDTLFYSASEFDTEVTGYWPFWPTPPVYPVFNAGGSFGGDITMCLMFTGQDAPYVGPGGTIDVSLVGTGGLAAAPDLAIFGAIPGLGIPYTLLWALEIRNASLYGVSDWNSYVVEAEGFIVGGYIAQQFNLVGEQGVVRGHLDFVDRPAGWIPPTYDPVADDVDYNIRAAYSGETGWGTAVPEPASLAALSLGVAMLVRRRKKA
ncbi:MAG: PEP-CTERM sorting domain-containing protein [Fimbriimonadaceae bacterium]|nr:PEP-CTERM sorting domain-containing protein [Fimbriimonadaceae bacterium]QOJ12612.1 MAG: PEP-CTERM sorting domain-containing protein [Chthonomonadaceae bacterium]